MVGVGVGAFVGLGLVVVKESGIEVGVAVEAMGGVCIKVKVGVEAGL